MPRSTDIPDSPYLVENVSTISGGQIDAVEDHLLPPGTAARLLNVETTFEGRRRRRLGAVQRGTAGAVGNPNGLHALESLGLNNMVAQWGNGLYSSGGDGVWAPRATPVSLMDTMYGSAQGRGATATATLYLASAVPYSANASLPFGNLVALDRNWGFTEIADVRPRSLLWFQSRLWWFNSCLTIHGQDVMGWSNIFDGRDFSNGQTVQIDREGGDPGVAMLPLRGGTPQLLLFKERSVHLLDIYWETDGFFPATANAMDFTSAKLTQIVNQTGCIATRGLTWVPGLSGADVLFLSREGIRSLKRSQTDAQGGAGLPLSAPIQGTIDRINWAQADKAAATYFDNTAYFAVPVDGAVTNNFIIAYNTLRDAWWTLDWQVADWAASKVDGTRKLFFFSQTSGTDGTSTYTNGNFVYETGSGNQDPFAAAINFEEDTRGITFPASEDPAEGLRARKIWRWLDLKLKGAATTATLLVDYRLDDTDTWTNLTAIGLDPSDSYPRLPVPLPFTFDSSRILKRAVGLQGISPGFKLQFRFRDNSSFARLQVLEFNVLAHRQAIQYR